MKRTFSNVSVLLISSLVLFYLITLIAVIVNGTEINDKVKIEGICFDSKGDVVYFDEVKNLLREYNMFTVTEKNGNKVYLSLPCIFTEKVIHDSK